MVTKEIKTEKKKPEPYTETVGRRKNAIARVRLTPAEKASLVVNEKDGAAYFSTEASRATAREALKAAQYPGLFAISAHVSGGGIHAQATALRHGITRALVKIDPELRKKLKKLGFIKRDPRAKERKKFGLKKARRAAQWSKR